MKTWSLQKKTVEKIYEADSAVRWRYGNTVQGKGKIEFPNEEKIY